MVPSPSDAHQAFGTYLLVALVPLAQRLGLESRFESGYFHSDDDYRQPDLLFAHAQHFTRRGCEGPAALVVEILSPRDESRDKLAFYATMAAAEVLFVDPESREFELLRLGAAGYEPIAPDAAGTVHCQALDVRFVRRDESAFVVCSETGEVSV